MKFYSFLIFYGLMAYGCSTIKSDAVANTSIATESIQESESSSEVWQDLKWSVLDATAVTNDMDGSGDGVLRRKIIYRDLSATKAASNVNGIVATKVCINRNGLVTYVEILGNETTIKDKEVLRKYLTAARGYKFQPDPKAPEQHCGKLKFTVNNPRG